MAQRVLVLSASVGAGHMRAAQAVDMTECGPDLQARAGPKSVSISLGLVGRGLCKEIIGHKSENFLHFSCYLLPFRNLPV